LTPVHLPSFAARVVPSSAMAQAPLGEPLFTPERYFALVDEGVLRPDDRVELLEGVIVAMAPQGPTHASIVTVVARLLGGLVGSEVAVRPQSPFLAGRSVPEPDVALVPGREMDYVGRHPDAAYLVVEIAESSLPQDRLTKAVIYAEAGIPEYWIVNLRDRVVEVLREPDRRLRLYASRRVVHPGEEIRLVALPDVAVSVAAILPPGEQDEPVGA
jgi:Uma2 family endonuclease